MGGSIYVLDASAVIAFVSNERGAARVGHILETPGRELMISRANWSEVVQVLCRAVELNEAIQLVDAFMIITDATVIEVDRENSLLATRIRIEHRLSFADSYAAAGASLSGGTLVAADADFSAMRKIIPVIQIR